MVIGSFENAYRKHGSRVDRSLRWVVERSHDVIIAVDEKLFVLSESDFAATVLGEKDSLANLDQSGTEGSIFESLAGSDSHDSAEVELGLVLGGEDDATLGLGDGFGLLDDDTVEEGSQSSEREHYKLFGKILFNKNI